LSAGDPNPHDVSGNLALELVDERSFPDARFASDEDDLPLPAQRRLQALAKLAKRCSSTNQPPAG
jgi:hypothetical protein